MFKRDFYKSAKGVYALFFCLLVSFTGMGQQRVFINFNVPVLVEEFDAPSKTWPEVRSTENVFVVDNGDYYITRTNPVTPYAIMAQWPNKVEEFHLKTSMKMGPANKNQSLGVILMASDNGQEGLIIEFNRSKDYRIKAIDGNGYRYLTPDGDDDGWERTYLLNGPGKENILEVKTQNGEYDVYINEKYLTSFSAHELFSGNFGIFIGPNTRARVDYFRVNSTRDAEEFTSLEGRNYAQMVKELTEENIRLRNQIADQRAVISEYTAGGAAGKINELETIIQNLEKQLSKANEDKLAFKEQLEKGGRGVDPELSSYLRETVQNLIDANQRLSNDVQSLEGENAKLRKSLEELTLRFLNYTQESEIKLAEYRREKRSRDKKGDEPVSTKILEEEPEEEISFWSNQTLEVEPETIWEGSLPKSNFMPSKTEK